MSKNLCFIVTVLFAGSLFAADPSPREEVEAAAKKLAEQPNYSWRTITAVQDGAQFRPGPTEGMTNQDGLSYIKSTYRDNEVEVVAKGEKAAVLDEDGTWVNVAELDSAEGRGRFLAIFARAAVVPARQAAELASQAQDLKKEGETISGELKEDAAKTLLRFRRRDEAVTVKDAKGAVKFWVKDGTLTKYEIKLKGLLTFNDNNVDVDRTTTVEIKDVGTTKLKVADQARKIVE